MPDERRARLYKQQSRRPCGPAALPFPIRAVFETSSEGHRWVFEAESIGFVPADCHHGEDDPGPTKKAYNFARSLSMADGRGRALTYSAEGLAA
jgi:hypothetical protein